MFCKIIEKILPGYLYPSKKPLENYPEKTVCGVGTENVHFFYKIENNYTYLLIGIRTKTNCVLPVIFLYPPVEYELIRLNMGTRRIYSIYLWL
jgi:hypothetical protein